MASPTPWTSVWVNSGSWWWTGRPGVLQSMGSQRVGHDWATELNFLQWDWVVRGLGSNLCNESCGQKGLSATERNCGFQRTQWSFRVCRCEAADHRSGEEASSLAPTQLLLVSPSCQLSSETAVFPGSSLGLGADASLDFQLGMAPRFLIALLTHLPGLAPTAQHRILAGWVQHLPGLYHHSDGWAGTIHGVPFPAQVLGP